MPRCLIGLGGNLGSVETTFRQVLGQLTAADGKPCAVSRVYRTAAVGRVAGDEFLNAVAAIDTDESADALLERLQRMEAELGRTRAIRWGPRTIDLDLLFYGDQVIDTRRLTVPHPACWYRRFVLDPLVEVAPDLVHPVKQAPIRLLRERLLPRPMVVAVTGNREPLIAEESARILSEFPQVRIVPWENSADPGQRLDPALLFWIREPSFRTAEPGNAADFQSLPRLSRIAVPTENSVTDFLRDVLESAIGEPVPISDSEARDSL